MLITLFALAATIEKRQAEDLVEILLPSEIKSFQAEQCHVVSLNPNPGCDKTFTFDLKGESIVPAQKDVSPYTGKVAFCVLRYLDTQTKKVVYTEIRYKVAITDISHLTTVTLHIGTPSKRGLAVANLITPKAPGNSDTESNRSGKLSKSSLFNYEPDRYYTFDDVARAIERGVAYVSVATDDGTENDNTGPGNYPMGELRGQSKRDCSAKCTCGVGTITFNAIGPAITFDYAQEDLFEGIKVKKNK